MRSVYVLTDGRHLFQFSEVKVRCSALIAGIVVGVISHLMATPFGLFFNDQTLRVDYFRTGTAEQENISIDVLRTEGQWPGSRTQLVDRLDRGNHRVQIVHKDDSRILFSQGYNTIFQEWQSTEPARQGIFRTFHESVRTPMPNQPVVLRFESRNRFGQFETVAETTIDPQAKNINREVRPPLAPVCSFVQNGLPSEKVDLVFLGDGYRPEEMEKYHRDTERAIASLFQNEPFKSRAKDFNVWVVDVCSVDAGIDEPCRSLWRSTALGTSYNALDSPRYILTIDNCAVRDFAAAAPYDAIAILVNSPRYGGGGIFNQFAISFTGNAPGEPDWWCDYVFVHEFGHSFAGLADEYYSSQISYLDYYPENTEPWEPNITAVLDTNNIKWAGLMDPATPVPTPWDKCRYDSLSALVQRLDAGHVDYKNGIAEMQAILRNPDVAGKIGCFEGAGYASRGLFRPAIDCRMFSKSMAPFCSVCQQAIEQVIDSQSR